jgi:hypothetical protein
MTSPQYELPALTPEDAAILPPRCVNLAGDQFAIKPAELVAGLSHSYS